MYVLNLNKIYSNSEPEQYEKVLRNQSVYFCYKSTVIYNILSVALIKS